MSSPSSSLNLFSFKGKIRVLHLTWFAFFLSFLVWFNHAPLMAAIRESLGLTDAEVSALLMINVALTIPARIIIGMLVDQFGPKLVYSILLFLSSLICFSFAIAESFQQLIITRFLLGFVGAGFVIGIRMIGEWFPARQVGLALRLADTLSSGEPQMLRNARLKRTEDGELSLALHGDMPLFFGKRANKELEALATALKLTPAVSRFPDLKV